MFALHLFFVYDSPVVLVLYVLIAASIHNFFYIYLNVSTVSLLHWFYPSVSDFVNDYLQVGTLQVILHHVFIGHFGVDLNRTFT